VAANKAAKGNKATAKSNTPQTVANPIAPMATNAILQALQNILGLASGNRGKGSSNYVTVGGAQGKLAGHISQPMFFVGSFGKGCNVAFVASAHGNLPGATTNGKYYSLPGFVRGLLPVYGSKCVALQVVTGAATQGLHQITLAKLLAIAQNIAARQLGATHKAAQFKPTAQIPMHLVNAPQPKTTVG